MIKVEGLYKKYGQVEILKGVSFEIKTGEVIAITGPSGAGKSTLLHIIGTLDKADKGQIWYDNLDIITLNDNKLAKFRNQEIGFVFQAHHLLPEFSAIENVMLPALLNKENFTKSKERAMGLLDLLGLKDRVEHKPTELSGGEQQRVAVARALINNPKVILADEPSGNLDSSNANDLHQLFFTLREKFGQTFVIVTHSPQLAELADRRINIADGIIVD